MRKAIVYFLLAITSPCVISEELPDIMAVDSEESNSVNSESKQTGSSSEEPVTSYIARLGKKDHFNSKGKRLSTVAEIIRQDRANYHDLNVPDDEDETDSLFYNKANREHLETMLSRGFIEKRTKKAILNGTPLVSVKVYKNTIEVYLQ